MKNLLIILFVAVLATVGFGQDRKDKKLLSYSFSNEDSVVVMISYNEIYNCTTWEFGYLQITILKDSVSLKHRRPKTQKTESYKVKNDAAFKHVYNFEKTGNKVSACGGYVGGNGVEAKLTINGSTTELVYCKDDWDGIKELISNIKKSK